MNNFLKVVYECISKTLQQNEDFHVWSKYGPFSLSIPFNSY